MSYKAKTEFPDSFLTLKNFHFSLTMATLLLAQQENLFVLDYQAGFVSSLVQ